MQSLQAVIPVFNDWESFSILLEELDRVAPSLPCPLSITAVDDGSTLPRPDFAAVLARLTSVHHVDIITLATNLGHQRAIAVGLCRSADEATSDAFVVMDSDGEDTPASLPELLARAGSQQDFCIVAARRKRSENLTFRAGYVVYKSLFKLVTGKKIDFGNFSLLSRTYLNRIVMIPDLWNNLAAALLRSRLPIQQVFVDRGKRYAGQSKMNLTSLVVHGFSAISVYADTIFVRLLIGTLGFAAITFIAVTIVVSLRLFVPAHATPGWATTVSFSMTIIVLQALFTALTSLLALLNNRVQRLTLPIIDYKPYVSRIDRLR